MLRRGPQRVGYGKGCCDKLLARWRDDRPKVSLSFFPPIVKIDDVDEYDVVHDLCVTPVTTF
ncbi:MAG: hypothetical protein ABIV21_06200 [Pyrinomonadaceae bacterium]